MPTPPPASCRPTKRGRRPSRSGSRPALAFLPIILLGLLGSRPLAAADGPPIELWPEGIPGRRDGGPAETVKDGKVYHVRRPTLRAYRPAAGASCGTAVILCPGGGYVRLPAEPGEGAEEKWLNRLGLTVFTLTYRFGDDGPSAPLRDVLRAIRFVRAHAGDYGVGPERIGVMGGSAGGHVATSAATLYDDPAGRTGAPLDRVSGRPDFVVLLYPVITMREPFVHRGSRGALLGPHPTAELIDHYSTELHVTKETPPTFLVATQADRSVPLENSLLYYQALRKAGVPAELHLFELGPHGFGFAPGLGPTSDWPARCEAWLRSHGWVAPVPRATAAEPPPALADDPGRPVTSGAFQPTWESLEQNYRTPDWFRDAKFGIWAHWSAQCQPEEGDWYARDMYLQGSKDYAYQVAHYGHPSVFGFKDIDNAWHAEAWDPEKLMGLYVAAGAHYFVALANHHDNFDCWDSKYQPWNSVRVGPHKDIVGTWARIARSYGLHFGVSNHSSHAWHWLQPAYGHDVDGPLAGVPYDGWLTKADGKGQWWEGLDPQDLYCGSRLPMPAVFPSEKAASDWHRVNDGHWFESVPPRDNGYTDKWYLRTRDLLHHYHPDLLYFDDEELPLGQAGLDIAADFYNDNAAANHGTPTAVLNAKKMTAAHRAGLVEDLERGVSNEIRPLPWQTDTCIGDWHYDRDVFAQHRYKTAVRVEQMLCDIVSKNGNLLLNIPLKGDGTIDSDEEKFLHELAGWMAVNGEGIFGTRPWKVFGEDAPRPPVASGGFNENKMAYTAEDIRFTAKGSDMLYAYFLGWPSSGELVIRSLGKGRAAIASVRLLGADEVKWSQEADGLHVRLPEGGAAGVSGLKLVLNH